MAESESMKAKVIDLTWTRGDTRAIIFTFTNQATGAAIDITGYTFTLVVDPSAEPPDAGGNLFTLSGSIVDGPNGKVSFQMAALEADQTPSEYYYNVQWVNGAEKFTPLIGKWTVVQDVDKS